MFHKAASSGGLVITKVALLLWGDDPLLLTETWIRMLNWVPILFDALSQMLTCFAYKLALAMLVSQKKRKEKKRKEKKKKLKEGLGSSSEERRQWESDTGHSLLLQFMQDVRQCSLG